jgi:hypothetical protein
MNVLESIVAFIIGAALVALFFLLCSAPAFVSCWNLGRVSSLQTKYSLINGCFVKTDRGFVPKKNWREF